MGNAGLVALVGLAAPLVSVDSTGSSLQDRLPTDDDLERFEPFILNGAGNVSAIVMDTAGAVKFETDPNERHTLASVAKVYILAAFLDTVSSEGRMPTDYENTLLEDMIEWSDNDAATELWALAGGREGLRAFLARERVNRPIMPDDESWGDLRASARDVAALLLNLYKGRLLDEEYTQLALGYMADVADDQAWGVGLARHDDEEVYLKNGWYPEEDGWIVNSAGIVAAGACEHIVVLLADSQPSLEEGKRFVNAAIGMLLEHLQRLAAIDACRPSVVNSAFSEGATP
jgi:beta-lactamase class A